MQNHVQSSNSFRITQNHLHLKVYLFSFWNCFQLVRISIISRSNVIKIIPNDAEKGQLGPLVLNQLGLNQMSILVSNTTKNINTHTKSCLRLQCPPIMLVTDADLPFLKFSKKVDIENIHMSGSGWFFHSPGSWCLRRPEYPIRT